MNDKQDAYLIHATAAVIQLELWCRLPDCICGSHLSLLMVHAKYLRCRTLLIISIVTCSPLGLPLTNFRSTFTRYRYVSTYPAIHDDKQKICWLTLRAQASSNPFHNYMWHSSQYASEVTSQLSQIEQVWVCKCTAIDLMAVELHHGCWHQLTKCIGSGIGPVDSKHL